MICCRCLARNYDDKTKSPIDISLPSAMTVYGGEALCLSDWLIAWHALKPVGASEEE